MNNILDVATLLLLLCARCAEAGLSKRDRTDFVYRYNRLRAGEGGANVKKVVSVGKMCASAFVFAHSFSSALCASSGRVEHLMRNT